MVPLMQLGSVTTQKIEIVTSLQTVSMRLTEVLLAEGQTSGMKKYIRDMIDDLKHSKTKDFVPKAPTVNLTSPADKALPNDLSNQVLSKNAEERVKQLDYQAFESERLQTDE